MLRARMRLPQPRADPVLTAPGKWKQLWGLSGKQSTSLYSRVLDQGPKRKKRSDIHSPPPPPDLLGILQFSSLWPLQMISQVCWFSLAQAAPRRRSRREASWERSSSLSEEAARLKDVNLKLCRSSARRATIKCFRAAFAVFHSLLVASAQSVRCVVFTEQCTETPPSFLQEEVRRSEKALHKWSDWSSYAVVTEKQ